VPDVDTHIEALSAISSEFSDFCKTHGKVTESRHACKGDRSYLD